MPLTAHNLTHAQSVNVIGLSRNMEAAVSAALTSRVRGFQVHRIPLYT